MGACLSSFFKLSRLLVAGLICISAAVSLPSPAGAEEISARFMADYGNVTVMEVTGNFDENTPEGAPNVAPRQAVAREFFRTHKDDYDFVTIFTNFDFKLNPNALAFYNSVKNDVGGIGKEIFDYSSLYGSNARLQGTIDMGNLHNLVTDPLNAKFEFTVDTLIHEMLHRWGAYLKFKDWNGSESSALLGYQASHWSFLFDSGGSTHLGNRWQNNGDGTFTSTAVRKYYSPLDLYLMGMIDKSKVPPTLLIENPAIDPSSMPELGSTISGTARYVNIDDIIAVEGERTPTAADSQKQFRMAFIYVVAPSTFKADDLPGIENVRNGYLTRYSILTDGKGLVQVTSTPLEELPANPGVRPPGTVPRTLPPNINDGLNWLVSHQQSDGSWTDFALTTERDTAESVATLQIFPTAQNQFQAGLNWLGTNASDTTDYLARRIEARVHAGGDSSPLVQELLSRRNSDGGWGGGRNFVSSPTDTALALKALAAAGYNDRGVTGKAVAYLQATQNPDGGWSGDSSASIIQPTAAVLSAYNSYRKSFNLETGIGKAMAFLAVKQNPDGGFGNSPSTVYDSSLALMALQAVNGDRISIGSGISYLLGHQSQDGSWNESPFQTALAMRAIWQATVDPDLSVKPEDVSIIPATITALPTNAVLNATIWNLGRSDVSQTRVALYEGSIAPDHKLAEQTLAFPGQSAVTVTFAIPVTSASGHIYHVVVDPDSQLAESNKNNNSAAKALQPEITYDFQVQASDIMIAPNPADIGKDVKISLKVANRGTSDAYSVPVRIFIDQPGTPMEIAQLSVDIPSGAAISREVTWRASLAGANLPLTVQADPNSIFTETNEDNNSAAVPLSVNASTLPNLSVSYRDMLITPSPAREGGSASISVLVKNDGFSTAENVKVNVFNGAASNGGTILGSQLIPAIPAGQSFLANIVWTGIAVNGGQLITVQVDPDNAIQELAKDDNFTFLDLDVLSLPDLAVSTSSVTIDPATPKSGDLVTVRVTVQNGGEQEARDVTVQLKEEGGVIGSTVIPLVNGNSQSVGSISYQNSGKTGSHQVTVLVDPENIIVERTRDNNSAVKTFSIQDANLWLTEPYISPDGDGVKDSTDFSFRLAAPSKVSVQVFDKQEKSVRTFSGGEMDNTTGATITWDGKNDAGSVVNDGTYQIKVINANGAILVSLPVEVDTNRSPLTDALGTRYLLQNNMTCQLPNNISEWSWLPHDSGVVFTNYYSYPNFPSGFYQMSPTGDDLRKISPEDWSDDTYDYYVDAGTIAISNDGTRIAFAVWKYERSTNSYQGGIWEQTIEGSGRRELFGGMELNIGKLKWSPDSKRIVFIYGPLSYWGYNAYELRVVDTEAGGMTIIDGGYPYWWYSDGVMWSPDSRSIAYSVNTHCNADKSYCHQEYEALKVAEVSGPTRIVHTSTNNYYTYSYLSWLADGRLLAEEYPRDGDRLLMLFNAKVPGTPAILQNESQYSEYTPSFTISPDLSNIAMVFQQVSDTGYSRSINLAGLDGSVTTVGNMGMAFPGYIDGPSDAPVKPIWSQAGDKVAYVERELRTNDNQYYENLVIYDRTSSESKKFAIATSNPPTFNNYTGSSASFKVNRLVAWLSDKLSILVDTVDGYFMVNTADGAISDFLPVEQEGWNDPDLRLSADQRYITYLQEATQSSACAKQSGQDIWTISSLLNLTSDLRITKNKSVVKLQGTSSDKNFAGYRLEYADIVSPDSWNLIMPPSDVPVVNGTFTDWVPPKEGAFHVKLTVWDKAGNEAVVRNRVAWGISTLVTGLYRDNEFIAPRNQDNPKKTVTLHYTALDAVHLKFSISNDKGDTVRNYTREHAGYAVDSIVWDGRDENGNLVPDGKYTIKLFDYEFAVEVDNTLPTVTIALSDITYDTKVAGYRVKLAAAAADARLKKWTVQVGTGENPQDWSTVASGTDSIPNYVKDYINGQIAFLKFKRFRIVAEDFAGNQSTAMSPFVENKVLFAAISSGETLMMLTGNNLELALEKGTQYTLNGIETAPDSTLKVVLQFSDGLGWQDILEQTDGGLISFSWKQPDNVTKPYGLRFKVITVSGAEYFSEIVKVNEVFNASYACSGLLGSNYLFEALQKLDVTVTSSTGKSVSLTYENSSVPSGNFALGTPIEVSSQQSYHVTMKGTGVSGSLHTFSGTLSKPDFCNSADDVVLGEIIPGIDDGGTGSGSSAVPFDVIYPEALVCGKTSGEIQLPTERLSLTGVERVAYLVKVGNALQIIGEVNLELEGPRRVSVDSSLLPSGSYPLSVILTNKDNSQKQADLGKVVVFDTEAPQSQLILPASPCPVRTATPKGARLGIDVSGIAKDNIKVAHYSLYYGIGENPATWLQAMTMGSDGVIKPIAGDGAVSGRLGTWDFTEISGSTFTLKLEVIDAVGNKGCATGVVSVDREVKINGYNLAPLIFSPNNDGNSDVVTSGFSLDEPVIADLSVSAIAKDLNGSDTLGIVQRRLQSALNLNAGAATFDWDGKGDQGAVLADNRYGVSLTVTDACGNTTSQWKPVELDNTPPSTLIGYPIAGNPLPPGIMLEIKGTATDSHFKSYLLEAGEGDTPTTWNTLATSEKPVSNAVITPWNTFGLKDRWTLRLSSEDFVGNKNVTATTIDLGIRKELVKNLSATPRFFSPNSDQKLDAATISYEVTDACNVKIDLLDGNGQSVKTFTAFTSGADKGNIIWEGKNSLGSTVPDGIYTIRLSVSLASNPQITQTETLSLVIDSTPPALAVTEPAEKAFLNRTDITVVGSINDPNLADYSVSTAGPPGAASLDAGTQNRMNYSFGRIADLSEDTYTMTVDARDLGENQTTLVRTFTIDRTPPKVTLNSPKAGEFYGNNKNLIAISGVVDEKNLERYSLRYGPGDAPTEWTEILAGTSLPSGSIPSSLKVGKADGIADGLYTISLYARDKAGLETEARARVVIDNTVPEVSLTYPKEGGYITKAIDIKGTVADSYFDKGTLELAEGPCATATKWAVFKNISATVSDGVLDSWKLLPADGEYCLRISATDKSGNKSEARVGFRIDTHPPATPRLTGQTENKTANSLNWTRSPETDVAGYNIYRGGQKLNAAPLGELAYPDYGLKEGTYAYFVKAVDLAGNESEASNVVNLKIDLNGPSVRISSPAAGASVSGLADIKGTAYSQDDFKEYRVSVGQGSSPSTWTVIRRSPLPISFGTLAQWDSLGSQDGAQFSIKLEGEDISGNVSSSQTTVTVDNTAPQTPVLLAAIPSSADVALTWKANTDTDLAGYLLYRNDQLANVTGIVAGSMKPYLVTGTNYTDKALPDGAYRYYLVAMDLAGNSSDQSNILEVSIDTHPPHMTISEPASGLRFDTKVMIKAESPDNDIATVQFKYKRPQDTDWSNLGAPLAKAPSMVYFDPKSMDLAYGDYQLQALAVDRGGKPDPAPPVVTLTYTDVTPPESPSDLSAKVNGADVNLTWNAVGEAGVSYNIYRWNSGTRARANSVPVMTAAFTDSGVPNGTYQYEVTAMDIAGNESKASEQALAKIYAPIIIQPFSPVKEPALNLTGNGVNPNSAVEITTVQPTGDSVKVTVIADASGSFKLEGITLAPGESNFTAVTSDSNGNISKNSETVYVAYGEVPAVPIGLVSTILGKDVALNWDANIEPDILGYYVYRNDYRLNGLYWIEPIQASASDEDYILPAVNAIDDNYGTYWSTTYSNDGTFTPVWMEITLPGPELISELDLEWYSEWDYSRNMQILYAGKDFEVQAWTGHAWVTIKKILENDQASNELFIDPPYRTDRLRLVITATTDLNVSKQIKLIDAYAVADDIDSTTSYNDTNRPDGKYLYEVSAVNQHGFISGRAATTAKLGHFPQAPDGLVATVQGSNVSLVWKSNPASDSVYYYNLQRWDGQEMVGNWWINSENPAFSDYDIENGSYRYRVSALAMGNNGWLESDFSNDAFATVAAIPPSAPFVPSVTSLPEGKALKVSWQPVSGANHYSIYRGINGGGPYIRAATGISSLSFVDSGLVNGITYFYVITASDSAGNESVYSGEASGIPGDLIAQSPAIFQPTVPGTPVTVHEGRVKVSGFAEPGAQVTVFSGDLQIGSSVGEARDIHLDRELVLNFTYVNQSPDGNTLAYIDSDGNLMLQNLQDSSLTTISTAGELKYPYDWLSPKWSPNGRYLVVQGNDYQGNDRVVLYDRVNDVMRSIATGTTSYDHDPAWSPSGDAIIFVGDGDSIWLANPLDGTTTRITGVGNYAYSPALSPDGTRVAFYDDNSVLYVFNRSDSGFSQLGDENNGETAVWSPDGSLLAFISYRDGNGDVYTYAPADGSITRRTSRQQDGYNIVWSPDGAQLGFASYTEDVESYWIVDINGHERKIFEANGEIVSSPEWRKDGALNLIDNQGIHSITPAGYFSLSQVNLFPGENNLSAIEIDGAGNISNQSDYATVVFDSGGLPDLILNDSDVILFPPFPKPGEDVLIAAKVLNPTSVYLDNVAVSLYLWDGTNDVTLLKTEILPHLDANGEATVFTRFNTGITGGNSTIIAVVDPADLIQEVVETNNHAARDLIVTDQERVSISTSISSSQFGVNQDASFEVTLMNSGSPTSGTLKVMVEDSNGNLVKLITSQPQDLPYALNQKLAFSWNTGATYAGSYRLHVLVTDEIETVTLAENATPFSILPDIKAGGSVTTDKQSYGPGENVVVNVSFNNSGVNHVMPQLKVRLRIVDSGNTRLFSEDKTFTNLLPAMGGSFSSVWNTGSLPAGAYAAVVDLSADGQLLESRTTVFNILPQPLLKGTLTADTATVLSGRGFTAGYTLLNHGNSTATGIVRITLQDPDGQTIVASSEQPAAIQVNGSMPGSVTFDTTGLTPRTYQVVLSFKSDATWQIISMVTIAVRDGLPPTITIVSPLEAASYSTDVSLSVFASDDFSGVDKVEYSIDNGAWKPLPLADASRGRYSSSWTPALTDNGSHSVSFRGVDRAGNIGHPVSVNFDVLNDTTAPVLVVSTLANESYTNNEVLNISGTVSDNVAVKELLINGASVPFNPDGSFSHALILADGSNTIEVTARDQAANPASDIRTIHLDQKAPLIDITTPADNSKTNNPEIIVNGNVDETSTVEVLLNGVAQPSERQGEAFKASLAAVYGPNTIEVTAVDQAMNKGTEKRTVTFDDQKPSLAITEPGQDIRTNRDVLILKGTVADTLTSVSVSIEMDGAIYTPAVTDGGFEQRLVMTQEKSYVFKVTATDEVGNSISVLRNVIYDITPPVLTIAAVVSPTVDDSQVISGTREADSEVVVTSSTATIGTVTYPSETTWHVSVTALKPGSNIVTASSTDGADNVATISKEIVYTVSTSNNIFSAAIFGNSNVTIAGNSYTDSYINSPSGWIRGKYKNGDVATNSLQPCGIKMSGATQVFGKLWVGQDGNPAIVGCINGGASVSGGSGALAVAKDMTPKADPAGGISIGAIKLSGHGSKTLAAGDYRVSTININGNSTLYLSGPLTLHVDGNFSLSGNSSIVITSGEVTIYQNGRKLQISCGSIVNTNKTPASLVIYGTAGLQTVDISGNTDLHALVYAPTAVIRLSGGQNTFGSIIGSSVDISGGSSVHYDEGLKE